MSNPPRAGTILGSKVILDEDGELRRVFDFRDHMPTRTPAFVTSYLEALAPRILRYQDFVSDLYAANSYERVPSTRGSVSHFQVLGDTLNSYSYSLPGKFNKLVVGLDASATVDFWKETQAATIALRAALQGSRPDTTVTELKPLIEEWSLSIEVESLMFPTLEAGQWLLGKQQVYP